MHLNEQEAENFIIQKEAKEKKIEESEDITGDTTTQLKSGD